MDGLLVIDKPSGPTSHDVVARVRRAVGDPRVGHTGTLDPAASGVLPLVLGRATRLARFLSARDKSYEAVVRVGMATDTYDAEGEPTTTRTDRPLPSMADIEAALESFRGTFLQQPPRYSAKKVAGQRSYRLARRDPASPLPDPVSVTAYAIEVTMVEGDVVGLRVDCSAGFFVRSLAHDLGVRLGSGAHLTALRRTRSGDFSLAGSVSLDAIERSPRDIADAVIPLTRMLTAFPAVVLTPEGVRWAQHGRDLDQGVTELFERRAGDVAAVMTPVLRLIDRSGELIGIAEPAASAGILHPSVVLM